jgi:hypothetical protein
VKKCSAILQSQFLEGSSRGKVNAVSDSGKKAGNIDAGRWGTQFVQMKEF